MTKIEFLEALQNAGFLQDLKYPIPLEKQILCIPPSHYDVIILKTKKIKTCNFTFQRYLSILSSEGLLDWEPFVKVDDLLGVILCINYNRYIVLEDNDYYMYSLQRDVQEVGCSTVLFSNYSAIYNNLNPVERAILDTSRLISCGFKSDKFRNMLKEKHDALNEFLRLTSPACSECTFTIDSLYHLNKVSTGNTSIRNCLNAYRIPATPDTDYATVEIATDYIKVVTPCDTFCISLSEYSTNFSKGYSLLALVGCILNLCDIQMQWNNVKYVYDISMSARNYEHIKNFSLTDILSI